MDHDALRALLPAYAAGDLDGARADVLRAHLAGGCAECLRDIFRRPVGRPRQIDAPAQAPPRPPTRRLPAALLPTIVALVVGGLAVRAVADLRRREIALRAEADRSALALADERAALEARVRRLEDETDGLRAEASAQTEAARSTRAENVRLQEAMRALEERADAARVAPPPSTLPPRCAACGRDAEPARDPMASRTARLVALHAVAPFQDPHGHALWDPERDRLHVYAFDLPPLPEGARYRVHLHFDDGRAQDGPVVHPGPDGTVSRLVPVGADAPRVQEIEIVLEPSERPVVAGRTESARP